ncbi:putative enoyl-CoA hydratase [Rhodococcus opacus PD630]|nr:putative enoyl-CoA hydratase [Rhodococcus opacus PD630]
MSLPVAMLAKEAVNHSFETTLGEGLRYERRAFHSAFGPDDQKDRPGRHRSATSLPGAETPLSRCPAALPRSPPAKECQ